MKVKAIADAKIKTDKIDATVLVHLLRADLVPEAWAPSERSRDLRVALREPMFYVRLRTMTNNRIVTVFDRYPEQTAQLKKLGDLFGKAGRAQLAQVNVSEIDRIQIDRGLAFIGDIDVRIKQSKTTRAMTKANANVKLLNTIPGIGEFFARLIDAEIDDISRFRSPKKLTAYWTRLAPCVLSLENEKPGAERHSVTKATGIRSRIGEWFRTEGQQKRFCPAERESLPIRRECRSKHSLTQGKAAYWTRLAPCVLSLETVMKPRVSVLTIGVADLERSLAFYRDGLGLPTEGIIGREFEHGAVAFFTLSGGMKLAIWRQDDIAHDTGLPKTAVSSTSFTIGHNVVRREEVDDVMDEAAGAGAEIVKPAQETFYGGYAGYFRDPNGHLWEVVWNPANIPAGNAE